MNFVFFNTIIAYLLVPSLKVALADDSIAPSQSLRDGQTLVSKGGTFELGFFTPGNSNKRYLGIWYKNIPVHTVVWVANRLNPINGSSGVLTMNSSGNILLTQNDTVVWNTTAPRIPQNPVAQLLDSGNFVIKEGNKEASPETGSYMWQSFDYPSDTLLPEMKFGWDLRIGLSWNLTAWKSWDDPAPGDFSNVAVLHNYPGSYLMKGNKIIHRLGPCQRQSGSPYVRPNQVYDYSCVWNENEMYYTSTLKNKSVLSRLVVNQTRNEHYRYIWSEAIKDWMIYTKVPGDYCDTYGLCGANGICIITETPMCRCLKGFRPKFSQELDLVDWSLGCVHNKPLNCEDKNKHGFMKLGSLKFPDTTHTWVDKTIGLEQCSEKCFNNCSCMAYTNSDTRGVGNGCVLWFGDLIDIRQFPNDGLDLYIRVHASELQGENVSKKRLTLIVATTTVTTVLGMIFVGSCYIYKVRRNSKGKQHVEADEDDLDLPLIELSKITNATHNFSIINKIGEGGFGPVYKGRLEDGQEIAVKKLSSWSTQGMTEFKNEVKLIVKLQHRNLVRLLGCCIQGHEKMLVYEYMPNNSLDYFIFDYTKGKLLDWSKRFHIIFGIARGLLYLHHDSRLRIIHRDLKVSNILLDENLNPKISDFGMARTFGGDQIEGNTKKIVGTYGYMAPEYAINGLYSIKSDVFSFGILLLEIISGKKNKGFLYPNLNYHLICYAWILWREDKALELIDTNIKESCIVSEVLRCIHISLLCAQHHPKDRPTMSSVVHMLTSENELPHPKQPGFFSIYRMKSSSSSQRQSSSTNEMSITEFEPR